jgi:hypothetical protein
MDPLIAARGTRPANQNLCARHMDAIGAGYF